MLRKLITIIAAAAAVVALGAGPAYARSEKPLVSSGSPDFCCGGVADMTTFAPGFEVWVHNNGPNVPYNTTLTSASDFSEINCVVAAGKNWCYLQDNLGDCMNVPTTGPYAYDVVPSSCPANDTAEEWARTAVNSGWIEENRHTGLLISCASDCNIIDVDSTGVVLNFPAS